MFACFDYFFKIEQKFSGTPYEYLLTSLIIFGCYCFVKVRKNNIFCAVLTDFKEGVKILDMLSRIIDSKSPPLRYIEEDEISITTNVKSSL